MSNGLFTVSLDFGAGVFTGTNYWVQMGVRTNGGGSFATLVPRQQLTPAPYALYAPQAGSLSGASAQASALCPVGTVLPYAGISGGSISTVQNWGLQMDTMPVPEVETWVAVALAGAFGAFWLSRQRGRKINRIGS